MAPNIYTNASYVINNWKTQIQIFLTSETPCHMLTNTYSLSVASTRIPTYSALLLVSDSSVGTGDIKRNEKTLSPSRYEIRIIISMLRLRDPRLLRSNILAKIRWRLEKLKFQFRSHSKAHCSAVPYYVLHHQQFPFSKSNIHLQLLFFHFRFPCQLSRGMSQLQRNNNNNSNKFVKPFRFGSNCIESMQSNKEGFHADKNSSSQREL